VLLDTPSVVEEVLRQESHEAVRELDAEKRNSKQPLPRLAKTDDFAFWDDTFFSKTKMRF
jgi:hypothetical protein